MMNKPRTRLLILAALALAMLACNFPGYAETTPVIFPDSDSQPVQDSGGAQEDETPASDQNTDQVLDTDDSTLPTATPTTKPSPTRTHTPTPTPTPTPTKTPTPKAGEPLTFQDPAWEWIEWHQIEGTGDLEGSIGALINGGTAPYKAQLDDRDIVSGLEVPLRWRLCNPMPATLKVWSADGQYAESKIWIWEVGCP